MVEKLVLNNKGKTTDPKEIRPVWDNTERMNHQSKLPHPHPKRNFVPAAVLTKSRHVPVNAAKQSSYRAAASVSAARRVNTAAPRSNDQGNFDNGCSRHMTGNKSYLIDYQEIDGGFVAFGGNAKGGKITGKGKTRTGKLDFEDVYFMKELKFNLFSILQICEKKNNVLFTNTECVVLSLDFKLLDESQVLLKVPRNNSMYSFDLKNVVPLGGKFDGKFDDGFFIGYSINSKAFRVFNTRTRFVKENLHINFLENKPNIAGTRPNWMFDIDSLTMSMNYEPVFPGNQTNGNASTKENINAGQAVKKTVPGPQYVLLMMLERKVLKFKERRMKFRIQQKKVTKMIKRRMLEIKKRPLENNLNKNLKDCLVKGRLLTLTVLTDLILQDKNANSNNTYMMFTPVSVAGSSYVNLAGSIHVNAVTLLNANLPTDPLMPDLEDTADLQDTRIFSGAYNDEVEGSVADFNNLEPTTVVYRNKKDKRRIVVRNKARLVAQGHTLEEGIDYDEAFAPVARIEVIRLFLAYASFMGFIVYQTDVKNAFLYGTIEKEVYVCQPFGFEDLQFPNKVYKVEKALYGLYQAPRAWYKTLSTTC
nr:copia protein [Tanacetum cinerariifolium]